MNMGEPATAEQLEHHPSRHVHYHSTSTSNSLVSQPVLVRTYSGSSSRPPSQPRSPARPHFHHERREDAKLPALNQFEFDQILAAVQNDVGKSLEAIAAIWASNKMSLASEYAAHLPPQGDVGRLGHGLHSARHGNGPDTTLTAVSEASSSTERLASSAPGAVLPNHEDEYHSKLPANHENGRDSKRHLLRNDITGTAQRSQNNSLDSDGSHSDLLKDIPGGNPRFRSTLDTNPLQRVVSPAKPIFANENSRSRNPEGPSATVQHLALGSGRFGLVSPSSLRSGSGSNRLDTPRLPQSAGAPAQVSLANVDCVVSSSISQRPGTAVDDSDLNSMPLVLESTTTLPADLGVSERSSITGINSTAIEHSLRQLLSTASTKASQH
ncbi:hypothetical protein L228DRAFT_25522 [Xylona heveae TC161]|uniref:Uncharacterized protein n=1 Tax=Xylona heveae (strain CBS 132557 / TC161) TaxID=1328760 RepID=A0A165ADB2_XYLHT|nr:hypothetical protein L228DRAFT_25522 [Xylona heveae TC161]KZF20289.1 hypothetical protein L228DRAFT_25522 [Xylona heveae TC161]